MIQELPLRSVRRSSRLSTQLVHTNVDVVPRPPKPLRKPKRSREDEVSLLSPRAIRALKRQRLSTSTASRLEATISVAAAAAVGRSIRRVKAAINTRPVPVRTNSPSKPLSASEEDHPSSFLSVATRLPCEPPAEQPIAISTHVTAHTSDPPLSPVESSYVPPSTLDAVLVPHVVDSTLNSLPPSPSHEDGASRSTPICIPRDPLREPHPSQNDENTPPHQITPHDVWLTPVSSNPTPSPEVAQGPAFVPDVEMAEPTLVEDDAEDLSVVIQPRLRNPSHRSDGSKIALVPKHREHYSMWKIACRDRVQVILREFGASAIQAHEQAHAAPYILQRRPLLLPSPLSEDFCNYTADNYSSSHDRVDEEMLDPDESDEEDDWEFDVDVEDYDMTDAIAKPNPELSSSPEPIPNLPRLSSIRASCFERGTQFMGRGTPPCQRRRADWSNDTCRLWLATTPSPSSRQFFRFDRPVGPRDSLRYDGDSADARMDHHSQNGEGIILDEFSQSVVSGELYPTFPGSPLPPSSPSHDPLSADWLDPALRAFPDPDKPASCLSGDLFVAQQENLDGHQQPLPHLEANSNGSQQEQEQQPQLFLQGHVIDASGSSIPPAEWATGLMNLDSLLVGNNGASGMSMSCDAALSDGSSWLVWSGEVQVPSSNLGSCAGIPPLIGVGGEFGMVDSSTLSRALG